MSQRLEAEDFERIIGQTIVLSIEELSFEARVSQVDRLERHSEEGRAPFSVIFSTEQADAFPQSIYTLNNPDMGEQMIFLVPIGPDETGMRYEAVFN